MGLFSFLSKNKQDPDDDFDVPVKPRRSRGAKASDAQEPLDPVLPEKKRARRRLIGATALVLAAIIGLPMIFDSEPKPLADDIAVQIPSRDKSLDKSAEKSVDKPLTPSHDHRLASPAPAEPAPVAVLPSPIAKIADQVPKTPPVAAAVKPESATVPVAEASAIAPAKEAPTRYEVQVAAVASKVKADELQDKLKKAGIKSHALKISTKAGERIRIRVGPFGSKAEADKMRARLVKLGLSGTLQPV